MLADVLKEKDKVRLERLAENEILKNKPIEEDIVLYFPRFNKIGGIETWIYNLSQLYDFALVYEGGDEKQLERIKNKKIRYVGQEIKCNLMIYGAVFGIVPSEASKKVAFIHADYGNEYFGAAIPDIPDDVEVIAVSEAAALGWEKKTECKPRVMYNPVIIEEPINKPLIIGVFSRLTREKGKERIEILVNELIKAGKPFLMPVFTDLPFDYPDKRVIMMDPDLNPYGWMRICDYIAQLSDTEAYAYTPIQALTMGIPVIITELPMLKEAKIDSSNAKILKFDMSNLDIDDLWNIPKFKYEPNQSRKEWDDLMKKKVFRELRKLANKVIGEEETNKIIDETIEEFKEEIKVENKKENKKKVAKK